MMRTLGAAIFVCIGGVCPTAAAQVLVTGRMDLPQQAERSLGPPKGGHVLLKVAKPASKRLGPALHLVFLRAQDTFPLPEPPKLTVAFDGLDFKPRITGCVVDGSVVVENRDVEPITLMLEDDTIGAVDGMASFTYKCSAGESDGLRTLKVLEWPHARGQIYVAGSGALALTDAQGNFRMQAARGKYLLRVVNESGVVLENPVEVGERSLDLGRITLAAKSEED